MHHPRGRRHPRHPRPHGPPATCRPGSWDQVPARTTRTPPCCQRHQRHQRYQHHQRHQRQAVRVPHRHADRRRAPLAHRWHSACRHSRYSWHSACRTPRRGRSHPPSRSQSRHTPRTAVAPDHLSLPERRKGTEDMPARARRQARHHGTPRNGPTRPCRATPGSDDPRQPACPRSSPALPRTWSTGRHGVPTHVRGLPPGGACPLPIYIFICSHYIVL